jgi:hypothetical protein
VHKTFSPLEVSSLSVNQLALQFSESILREATHARRVAAMLPIAMGYMVRADHSVIGVWDTEFG